jgi:hypothetical protein
MNFQVLQKAGIFQTAERLLNDNSGTIIIIIIIILITNIFLVDTYTYVQKTRVSPIRCNNLSSRFVTAKYPKQHTLPYRVRPLLKVHLVFATLLSETSLYQTIVNDPTNRGVMKQTVWILPFRLYKGGSLHK